MVGFFGNNSAKIAYPANDNCVCMCVCVEFAYNYDL